jgi:hypothetical protein
VTAIAAASSNTVAIVTVIVAGIVGVFGPIVAGAFLWLTTGRTIRAERERHRDELSFQERETDLAELRRILDALAEHVFAIKEGVDAVIRAAEWRRAEDRPELHEMWERRQRESAQRLETALEKAAQEIQRVTLRLGSEVDPLVRAAVLVRHTGTGVHLRLFGVTSPEAASIEAAERERDTLKPLVDRFATEARKFTAARLHEEPPAIAPVPKPEWPRYDGLLGNLRAPPRKKPTGPP